ncbi:tetratricopeptide (TPR) repeat protein [Clostridium saccharoperbutylacetonicum]|uniref:TPR repeat-containing protein n=1 Tax=Clostridium saccharoperbutylacetonicum N1-4(HMT) TaxID=931276 RepID=M1MNB6_9CLOT|nr:tetratricopeptide repeat protein [Clostridium saccharoperbutylacetonicum]AGF57693.1 TPR repeat-containing protein [Clostridium saccharoperbutylacetonicum N1-4(HMT)]NRT61539.1 tetratricopeptide (TPR) repeat protein [Clostridium saccharoperbutylacetonicum]NSB24862.1 tetratricopeptide (TPR) repeat protein [Clostridium saccharoperbutylacetonicum]NSB44232.1 tetratricopeptide (TPR) repeat protein [Clostridium saccharoperbutylacetonicum]
MSEKNKKYHITKISNAKVNESSGTILEAEKRLSESMIWKLQSDFFANQGPEAWIKGIVPQYITTNPYIANQYAKTVFGYLRDYAAREDMDKNAVIYIMELAAGVGRFTYTFLKRFLQLIENSSLKNIKFKYLVTDFAERNIEYWQNHSFLKPYFESGILDCATFDISKDEEIKLRYSGEVLSSGKMKNPLILFANYTFDSLPQDTFYVNEGEIFEGLISITSQGENNDPNDKSILAGLDYYYTDKKIEDMNYYEDKILNDVLKHYKKSLEDTAFYMPIIGLRCITRLRKLFNDDVILISADKGYKNEEVMNKNYHPYLSKHGCVSMTVNFHALELYFKGLGGKAIHSIYDHESINVSLFMLSQSNHDLIETSMAYNEVIETIGPDDFYNMKKAIMPLSSSLTTKELLTFLRFTIWDSRTLLELYNILLERIPSEEDFPKDELITAINKAWEYYFPIGEEGDLGYYFGSILGYLGQDEDALRFFESSLEFYGECPETNYEIALCYYNLQQVDKALEYAEKALNIDPDFEEGLNLKNMIIEILTD